MTANEDDACTTPAPLLQAERLLSIQSHVVSGYVGRCYLAHFLEQRLNLRSVRWR